MVRTGEKGNIVCGGKAPRKQAASQPARKSARKPSKKRDKLNPIKRQPIPAWQQPITDFFKHEEIQEEKAVQDIQEQDEDNQTETDNAAACQVKTEHVENDDDKQNTVENNENEKSEQPLEGTLGQKRAQPQDEAPSKRRKWPVNI